MKIALIPIALTALLATGCASSARVAKLEQEVGYLNQSVSRALAITDRLSIKSDEGGSHWIYVTR